MTDEVVEPTIGILDDPADEVRLLNELAAGSPTAMATDSGGVLVLHHADVERLAHDPGMVGVGLTLFDFMGIDDGPLRRWYGSLMFTNEGPYHSRMRRLVSRAFTARSVERLRDETARLVDHAYGEIGEAGGGDLLAALKSAPMRVMCALLGVPETDLDAFIGWADALSPTFGVMDEQEQAAAGAAIVELLDYLGGMIEGFDTSRDPDDGRGHLLAALLEAEEDGDRLTRHETVDMVANLLVGGHDTTGSQIGCTLLTLLRDTSALAAVRADATVARSAVWETMRVEPSLTVIPRVNVQPVDVGGVERPVGTLFLLCLASANRDPRVWSEPNRFLVDRFVAPDVPKPLSFGTGSHFCLGAHMARMTLDEVVVGLSNHPVSLAGDPASIEWRQVLGRSPSAIEVTSD
jgi:cytochrome P450